MKRIFAILMVALFMVSVMALTASMAFASPFKDKEDCRKHERQLDNFGFNNRGGCVSSTNH